MVMDDFSAPHFFPSSLDRQKFVAGIYLMGGMSMKAGVENAHADVACKYPGPKSIFPFAFRTHAHSLGVFEGVGEGEGGRARCEVLHWPSCAGKQIVGYVIKSGEWEVIGTRSPQDPQVCVEVNSLK